MLRLYTGWFARQTALPLTEESQLRLDSDRDAVHIVTIHKSKGLEYPVVFCPFLYGQARIGDGQILTHERGLVLDLGSEEFSRRRESALLEARAELIRLTYAPQMGHLHRMINKAASGEPVAYGVWCGVAGAIAYILIQLTHTEEPYAFNTQRLIRSERDGLPRDLE